MKNKLVPVIALLLLVSCSDNLDSIKDEFGLRQNSERAKLNLVQLNSDFEIVEDETYEGRRFIFVNKNELKISTPGYLRKIIMLDSTRSAISYEEDYFISPIEKKYLIISHNYYLDETIITLQSDNKSAILNSMQADSILKIWEVQHNPF